MEDIPPARVQSIARVRPPNEHELSEVDPQVILEVSENRLFLYEDDVAHEFDIDGAYGQESTSQDLFADVVMTLVQHVFEGYNAALITYGASSTGKAFSLYRDPGRGVIEEAGEELFQMIGSDPRREFLVTLSVYQIYDETVVDLISPQLGKSLPLEEHRMYGTIVSDLAEIVVTDLQELIGFLFQAIKVHDRLRHRDVSRQKPHMIVDIKVLSRDRVDIMSPVAHGILRFVETSGSGGLAIDTDPSLKALKEVIEVLSSGQPHHTAPFSKSCLTRILSMCLGGNCLTRFMGCMDPMARHKQNTKNTLALTVIAKQVVNHPTVNRSMITETIRELRDEIRKARAKLRLDRPGNLLHDVDPRSLERLEALIAQLDKAKEETWDAVRKRSHVSQVVRKRHLRRENLLVIMFDDLVALDAQSGDIMRKIEQYRHNLVRQSHVMRKHLRALESLQYDYETSMAERRARYEERVAMQAEVTAEEADKDAEHEDELNELSALIQNVRKIVDMEDRQRRIHLTAGERLQLHMEKDNEDWRDLDQMFVTSPRARKKLQQNQKELQSALSDLEASYSQLEKSVPTEKMRNMEIDYVEKAAVLRKDNITLKWEKDELLGRLMERDVRYKVHMLRMQEQMFMVFRDYRRHFDEQFRRMQSKYRDMTDISVKDALRLFDVNLKLQQQLEVITNQNGVRTSVRRRGNWDGDLDRKHDGSSDEE